MIIWVVKIFFVQFFCVFLPPLLNIFCLLGPYHFCPLSSSSLHEMLPWYFQFSRRENLSHSIAFLYFFALCIEEGLLISSCYSLKVCIQLGISFPFSLAFLIFFFSQLFVRPPQTTILPFCISFSWGWSWSLPPVQCHEPPSIVHQSLCLSDLIPWICYYHCIIIMDLI